LRRKLRRRTWRQRCTVGFGTLGRKSAPLPAWDRTAGEQVRREFGWESYLAQSYQVQTELSGQVLTLSYSPDLGRSVPLPRMTLNSSGLSCALHSSSVFWISKSMLELVGVDARAPMRLVRWWLGAARSPSLGTAETLGGRETRGMAAGLAISQVSRRCTDVVNVTFIQPCAFGDI